MKLPDEKPAVPDALLIALGHPPAFYEGELSDRVGMPGLRVTRKDNGHTVAFYTLAKLRRLHREATGEGEIEPS